MIQACPHLLSSQDSCRRTPLHIATDSRVNRLLIKYLEKACPEACTMQDVDEMTPLHMALGGAMPNLFSERIGLAPKMGIFYSTP
jgi:ankyrin repeat protein